MTSSTAYYDVLDSPLGPVFVGGSEAGLHRVEFIDPERGRDEAHWLACLARDAGQPAARDPRRAAPAVAALRAYFEGRATSFDLPLAPRGTAFQRAVWSALEAIAPGTTVSYVSIARAIGRPTASRAVGGAVGSNPLSVVIPCHRVVGSNGALTGYGSGIPRKVWLLQHEAQALVGASEALQQALLAS